MVAYKKTVLLLFSSIIFISCSTKEYRKQESVFIVFKTPSFKHADLGFIYESSDEIKVEIYASGQPLVSLRITNENVCMSLLQCMSKKSFNKDILSLFYPEDLIEQVFRGKAIFGGENLIETRNGFTQKIVKKDKYNIQYNVLNKQILFRDTINDILIKVKRIDR